MDTQSIIEIITDYFKTQPVEKAWLLGSYSRGEQIIRYINDTDWQMWEISEI